MTCDSVLVVWFWTPFCFPFNPLFSHACDHQTALVTNAVRDVGEGHVHMVLA